MRESPGILHMYMRARILKLRLFCMDSFDYEDLKDFIESKNMKIEDIKSMKIWKGKIELTNISGKISYDLEEMDKFQCSSCKYCVDMTSENTDISFGGVGSPEGWTSVLTRTSIGYEKFNEAVNSDYLEARILEKKEMNRVLNLAKMKKVQMYGLNRRNKCNS